MSMMLTIVVMVKEIKITKFPSQDTLQLRCLCICMTVCMCVYLCRHNYQRTKEYVSILFN